MFMKQVELSVEVMKNLGLRLTKFVSAMATLLPTAYLLLLHSKGT